MKSNLKKTVALLTAFVLCLGVFQFAFETLIDATKQQISPSAQQSGNDVVNPQSPVSSDRYYSRDELESIAKLADGNKTHAEIEAMDDAQLGAYIEENLKAERFDGIVNLQNPTDKETLAENREALEEIAVILGGDDVEDMSHSDLQAFVEEKLNASLPTDKQDTPVADELTQTDNISEPIADSAAKQENSTPDSDMSYLPDYEDKKDAFNENGEIEKPFDEVFPEYMETEAVDYDDETVLIRFATDFDGKITSAMKKAGVAKLEKMFATEKSVWYEGFLKKGTDTKEAVEDLREIDVIELVEYNFTIRTTAMDDYEEIDENISSNKLVAHQWHLNYCGIGKGNKVLDNAGGNPSVVVAVIDTGVDYNHEDLHDNIWVNEKEIPGNGIDDDDNGYVDDYYGVNIITGNGNGDDDNGHGTHVAGIIAAQNNHLGTVGIAYNTKIMPIKAAMASGTLHQSDIAKAVLYAFENGAEVINMSFGGTTCSIAVQDALAAAYTRCVLVASAGNEGAVNENFTMSIPNYPSALSYVIGVMSVGRSGVESAFSNFDYAPYTSYEYEVYAPGEEIISTVPGNKYASWSGTSMAAPMVSAVAALIRSQYPDRNTYPTKFIYGQITSTSENTAVCPGHPQYMIEPYKHNVPDIVNLHAALTKIPKPEVGLSEYYVFDTDGFAADTANKNNGDGVIDAGETVALGMILRNRWGMSENTVVSIDTLSMAGIADPYIEIINPEINYGSIGTYSTGDCGKIFEDELFVAWEDPFYIRIKPDCPNDYIFRINVNITCKNALDPDDEADYTTSSQILLTVRNGYVLPAVISEDMTLTPDNLYIIPNATTIQPGVTVTVEPGTHIQFWSDDALDPYADEYIAYLRVEGKFLVEGTAEDPVYMYPSDLMSKYVVNLFEVSVDYAGEKEDTNGRIEIRHADITNLGNGSRSNYISLLSDCILRKNTEDNMYHRYISSGKIYNSSVYSMGYFNAVNCAFYKICASYYNQMSIDSSCTFDTCAFIDCAFSFGAGNKFTNNVFYGNNFQSTTHGEGSSFYTENSSYTAPSNVIDSITENQVKLVYVPETGATYVAIEAYYASYYKDYYEWDFAIFETEQELDRVRNFNLFTFDYYGSHDYGYDVSIYFENDIAYWSDGTPVGDFIQKNGTDKYLSIWNKSLQGNTPGYVLFEIPGEIYVSDITFNEFEVDIDLESVYVVKPVTQPVPFAAEDLIFESTDETIATVDESGLITPIAKGSADIYVYSKDRKVCNYITVNVVDYVALEDMDFAKSTTEIEVGTSFTFVPSFTPANTTRKNVVFSSSAPEIISVNNFGTATAHKRGEAVISMTNEGITKEITVYGYKKATSLQFTENGNVFLLRDRSADLPQVIYGEADVNLQWKSSDDTVLTVQDNKLVFNGSGKVILQVTDTRSGLSDDITLYVSSDESLPVIKKADGRYYRYVLFENGDFAQLNNNGFAIIKTDIKDISVSHDNIMLLHNDGHILYAQYCSEFSGANPIQWNTLTAIDGVQKIFAGQGTYFAITEDGICYAWGNNNNNCSGTGAITSFTTPKMVNLENVTDVFSTYEGAYFTYFRTADNKLYYAGGRNNIALPEQEAENVSKIDLYGNNTAYALQNGKWYELDCDGLPERPYYANDTDGHTAGFVITDDIPYYYPYSTSSELYVISGITNAVNIVDLSNSWYANYVKYIFCADGRIFGFGDHDRNAFAGGAVNDVPYTDAVLVPIFNYEKRELGLEESNLTATRTADGSYVNVLKEDALTLDFNGKLSSYSGQLYADGKQIPFRLSGNHDNLTVSLKNGFEKGVIYRFVIETNGISCNYLANMQENLTVEFIYDAPFFNEISFSEDSIVLDTQTTVRINPVTAPYAVNHNALVFESADETVVRVDENGIITPVQKGNTTVYVSSADKTVRAGIAVHVVDYVALADMDFATKTTEIEVGTAFTFVPSFTPADTTRKNVSFASSAPEIISVNNFGTAIAHKRGEAVISMTNEGITKEITVQAYKKATQLNFTENGKVYLLKDESADLPQVSYGDADVNIVWKSSDDTVLTVRNGKLVFNSSGRVMLQATDTRTGLSDEITLYVTSDESLTAVKKIDGRLSSDKYVLFENGDFAHLNTNGFTVLETDVKDMSVANEYTVLLKKDGTVRYGSDIGYYTYALKTLPSLSNVKKVSAGSGTYFAVTEKGVCYAWGRNGNVCSGTGQTNAFETPVMVNLQNVTDVFSTYDGCDFTYFLTSDGKLYLAGGSNSYTTPQQVAENVSKLDVFGNSFPVALIDGAWYKLTQSGIDLSGAYFSEDKDGHTAGFSIKNGTVYAYERYNSTSSIIPGIFNAVNVIAITNPWQNYETCYIFCEDGTVFAYGRNERGDMAGGTVEWQVEKTDPVLVPLFSYAKPALALEKTNLTGNDGDVNILNGNALTLDFNGKLKNHSAQLFEDGEQIPCSLECSFDTVTVSLQDGFKADAQYRIQILRSGIGCEYLSDMTQTLVLDFMVAEAETEEETTEEEITAEVTTEEETTEEEITEEETTEEEITEEEVTEEETTVTEEDTTQDVIPEEDRETVTYREALVDEGIVRYYLTVDEVTQKANTVYATCNPYFFNNCILNRISTDYDVDHWLRVLAPQNNSYREVALGYNYWGTTNETAIGHQIIDYTDFQVYSKINYAPFLTQAPENTFPFVTAVQIFNEDGEEVYTVGNEKITVRVSFNRDMDTGIPLSVCFGSSYPYAEYEISGSYTNARTWEGTITLSTVIENGNQYFTISDGKAAGTNLQFFTDRYRFGFVIDTTAAQALVMQGIATDTGIELTWTQDDFDTLMGYNVYRSTSEDRYYQRLNSSVIPDDTKTFFDDTIEPGVVYYYNFTVVKTDLTESTPSGKISIMSKDTMAPDIYHTPVYIAKTGSNIIITATITDNLIVNTAAVYYRTVGETEWKTAVMNKFNDKYSAIIYATDVTLNGIEYYIDAFDGITHTYKASAQKPYIITVQEALGDDALGDVNGDGKISNLDALMLLQAINDLLNLDAQQFARADLNADGELTATEALRILQYVSGTIGSVRM